MSIIVMEIPNSIESTTILTFNDALLETHMENIRTEKVIYNWVFFEIKVQK